MPRPSHFLRFWALGLALLLTAGGAFAAAKAPPAASKAARTAPAKPKTRPKGAGKPRKPHTRLERWYTHWNGPVHRPPRPEDDFDPAASLPSDPTRFTWTLSLDRLPKNEKAPDQGGVPVFVMDRSKRSLMAEAGLRKAGLEVEVVSLLGRYGMHYYEVKTTSNPPESFWVPGYYLLPKLKKDASPAK